MSRLPVSGPPGEVVVDVGALTPAAAAKLARSLARGPRRALELTKRAITGATLAELDAALAREHEGQCELLVSADFAEGMSSILEKRRPSFS